MRRILILISALATALAPLLGVPPRASAATTVCALYCDTRDPSLARQETFTFPTPNVTVNGRVVELHDSVWIDRSWDAGSTWDGLLGKAWIPSTWAGTRTLMYNMYDPSDLSNGVLTESCDALNATCDDNQKQFKGIFMRFLGELNGDGSVGAGTARSFRLRRGRCGLRTVPR